MNWSHNSLKILGLTATETGILQVLKHPQNVKDIARNSGISRTGVNYCIKNLLKKGLIVYTKRGQRKLYVSLEPQQVINELQYTIDSINIESGKKKGARIKTSKENEFTIHVGTQEIIPAYQRIALENKNERIRAIQHHRSYNELLEKITSKQLVNFNQAIIENKLIIDGMLNKSAYKAYQEEINKNPEKYKGAVESLEGRMADYTSFPDEYFNYSSEIWLFKNTALIINWREEVAIEIINQNMTSFLKDMFEFVKMGGEKIDHNEAMRRILNKKPQ